MAFDNVKNNLGSIVTSLETVAKSATDTLTTVQQASQQIDQEVQGLEERTRSNYERMREALGDLKDQTRNDIGELRGLLGGATDEWAEAVRQQLDLIEIGAVKIEDFLRVWGEARIETEEGTKRIREILDDVNIREFTNEIQELMKQIREGGDALGQTLDFLAKRGGTLASTIRGWVQGLEEGTLSVERFIRLLEALKREFPGSDLANLADALEQAARGGDFGR